MGKNWKTTISGIVAGLPQLITVVTPMLPQKWANVLTGIGMVLFALAAKDANVTGGTVKQ
jgi:hypothetical protein